MIKIIVNRHIDKYNNSTKLKLLLFISVENDRHI